MGKKKKKHRHKHEYYKIVHKDYGRGARSKVSIVERRSDGKLLIWKQPLLDDHWHHESLRKEIKRAKLWRKCGASKVKACWHPDKRSLLKTYVKGDTLGQMIKNDRISFSIESRQLKALREFLGLLIYSKRYIYDLIGENLVFDGKRWHIIDSGSVRDRKSRSDIKREYKEELLRRWPEMLSSDTEINSLKLFLDSVKPVKFRK